MNTIDLNFQLQRDEYYAAAEFFRQQRKAFPKPFIGTLFFVGLGIFLWAALGWWGFGLLCILLGVALLGLAEPLRGHLFQQKWEREPLYRAQQTFSFRPDGVFFRWDLAEALLPWTYYERMLENADGFLLVYGETFNFFPKRVFTNAEEMQQFRNLVQQKIASQAS